MQSITYVGLDVHKQSISYCVKTAEGRIVGEGVVSATRGALTQWAGALEPPWLGAMEATLFTGWIYDHLRPYAEELKVGHPLMLRAIVASKKKNDRVDARKLADLLRCDLFPECYIAAPQIRQLRRVLRFRNLILRQAIRMKNKIAGLLMEVGAPYHKQKLHGKRCFAQLLTDLEDVPASVIELLRMSRGTMELFEGMQRQLLEGLREHLALAERVERLMSIPGVGQVTALTWALEIGEPERFGSVRQAISYCGLCSAQDSSAGKERRGPLSKQRNGHLQSVLVEAAKLAPRWNPQLAALYQREVKRGHRNRATLAVARKLVTYLLAVDKRQTPFEPKDRLQAAS
jgi:transposase